MPKKSYLIWVILTLIWILFGMLILPAQLEAADSITFQRNGSNQKLQRYIYLGEGNVLLCQNLEDFNQKKPFPIDSSDRRYLGCGIKSAQNVLRYFNISMSQDDIKKIIPTGSFRGNIWTYPDDLCNGLNKILDEQGCGIQATISHNVKNTKEFIFYRLTSGFPVIALVNDGNHYVSIFGFKLSNGFYVHNNASTEWRSDINTSFSTFQSIFSSVSFGYNGYEPGTLISFKFKENKPTHVKPRPDPNEPTGDQVQPNNGHPGRPK